MRRSNVNEAKVMQVVLVRSVIGDGTQSNPYRELYEYFSIDGKLLAEAFPTNVAWSTDAVEQE